MDDRKFRVMVCRFPGGNIEHPASTTWVMRTVLEMALDPRIGPENIQHAWEADTPITMVRNRAIQAALENNIDYLLMIDNDMGPDCELGVDPLAKPFWKTAWELMMSHREKGPCVAFAPYVGPPPEEPVYCFRWAEKHVGSRLIAVLSMVGQDWATEQHGIWEAAAGCTGLMLIDMRAIPHLPKPWFAYEWGDKEQTEKVTTEDVYFTRNCSLLGIPQYCLWDCWAAHHKLKACLKPRMVRPTTMSKEFQTALLERLGSDEGFMHAGDKNAVAFVAPDAEAKAKLRNILSFAVKRSEEAV